MIKTRLVGLLSHAKKYIVYTIFWQWVALLSQILAVFSIAGLLERIVYGTVTMPVIQQTILILLLVVCIRFFCERMGARASYLASVDVKRILREKIYEKMLKLGASYSEQISSSKVVQVTTEGVEQLETYFGKYLPQLFYSLIAPLTLFVILGRVNLKASVKVVQVTTEGVEQLETYFGKYLPQLFYSLIAPLTLFVILGRVNLKASVILLICVPLIPISIVAVQKFAKKLLNKYWSIYTGLGDSFLENLQGLTTLKIYQADQKKADEMDEESQKFRKITMKVLTMQLNSTSVMDVLQGLTTLKIYQADQKKADEMDEESQKFRKITMKVLTMQLNSTSVMDVVAYGGAAVGMAVAVSEFLKGNLQIAGTLCIVLLASEFFLPLRLLGSFFHIAMNGMAASDKIFKILDLPEPEAKERRLPEGALSVSFQNVHFSYEKDREILKGIDLELPAGNFVSLVGESGCGKSTIAGILAAKNRKYTGEIMIGGVPLAEINEEDLMKHVVLVRHNSYLFKGTVEENLKMANPDATKEEMEKVLQKVNLLGFLETQEGLQTQLLEKAGNLSGENLKMANPDATKEEMEKVLQKVNLLGFLETQEGLQTQLLEKAGNLSGGQCQRLAIARALLKQNAAVYIFDEAASNIDVESEELIMNVIHELAKTKTVLLISHRLANVVKSDRIYFLKDGKIAESGKHEGLMQKKGTYQYLFESQMALENYGKRGTV